MHREGVGVVFQLPSLPSDAGCLQPSTATSEARRQPVVV